MSSLGSSLVSTRTTVREDLVWPEGLVPLAHLGNGGMARVTLAMAVGDFDFSTPVAVKRLLPKYLDQPSFVDMFLDEAFVAARIVHPNVVTVREVRRHRDEPVMILEYLEGVTASRLIREHLARGGAQLPIASAARVVLDGLHGLTAAHALRSDVDGHPEGLVHRDISPQNVFVCSNGHTKLIDFGITRLRGRITKTRAGSIKGKFAYMAPEQVDGEYDQRVDVYAMGVVLYELLTSSRLFRGSNERETLAAIMAAERPSVKERRPDCPEMLAEVVRVAIQARPDARFGSAEAMARALTDALASLDAFDARAGLSRAVLDAAGTELSELRGLIAANRASLPPSRASRAGAVWVDETERSATSDTSALLDASTDREISLDTRFASLVPPVEHVLPVEDGSARRTWGQVFTSALALFVLVMAVAMWWLGCVAEPLSPSWPPVEDTNGTLPSAPGSSVSGRSGVGPSGAVGVGAVGVGAVGVGAVGVGAVGPSGSSTSSSALPPPEWRSSAASLDRPVSGARCEPASADCPTGEVCARGVDPRDWSYGRCVPIRSSSREVSLPLRHSNGVRATHSGRDVDGSHAYLDTLFALDLVAEADAAEPRGRVVAVDAGVVVDLHAGCPEPPPGTDDPCGSGYGNHVRLRHDDGTYSFYAHLIDVTVHRGEHVEAGVPLGTEGWTGRAGARHLHFAMQVRTETGAWQSVPYRLRVDGASIEVATLRCTWQSPCDVWR
jgi:serine/threonine protein kinase